MTKLNEYREQITLHLVRITGDLEYLKEKVDNCENHLEKINGRVRKTENQVYWILGVGAAITTVLSYFIYQV